jgi:uncharacterized membrane protein YkoI
MTSRSKFLIIGASALALAAGGAGLAIAGGGGDDAAEGPDVPISGNPLDQASAAALKHVGEGKVTDTEEGDEESYYEVEVRRDDGSQVDVQLNRSFEVVGQESDGNEDDSDD